MTAPVGNRLKAPEEEKTCLKKLLTEFQSKVLTTDQTCGKPVRAVEHYRFLAENVWMGTLRNVDCGR